MRKFIIFAVIAIFSVMIACGGQDGAQAGKAKGEAKHVAAFFDALFQKGDLVAAFDMLAAQDKAMLGMMIPGFYDFITGKETEAVGDDMKLMRVMLQEIVPIPNNLINYQIGEPQGSGDTIIVPVTFNTITEDLEGFLKEHVDPDLYDKMDNLDNLDLPLNEKKEIVKKAIGQAKAAIKGKTFEMKSSTNDITLIKENGQWKLAILASGLMNSLGGM